MRKLIRFDLLTPSEPNRSVAFLTLFSKHVLSCFNIQSDILLSEIFSFLKLTQRILKSTSGEQLPRFIILI